MKIKKTIKIERKNLNELASLECVEKATVKGNHTVRLKEEYTKGSRTLHGGEYLVQYDCGLYQRYGEEAILRLVNTP